MSLISSSATENHYHQRGGGENESSSAARRRAGYFRWKVALDLVIAYLLLIPAGTAIAVLVLLVRATSNGPGIYQQSRVGKNGRCFMMYKIRTMRVDAEAVSGPVWTQPDDPRMTFLGRILRNLHLDELPQIFNVLRGEMSLVGPRPERPEFVRVLSEAVPHYRDRLLVRPGITGLAQINLPPDTDLISVRRKLAFDRDYIQRGSLWLDVRLLLCTALRVFKAPEGFLTGVLGLRRPELLAAISGSCEISPGIPGTSRGSAENRSGPEEATPGTLLLQAAQASSSNGELHAESHRASNAMTAQKPR